MFPATDNSTVTFLNLYLFVDVRLLLLLYVSKGHNSDLLSSHNYDLSFISYRLTLSYCTSIRSINYISICKLSIYNKHVLVSIYTACPLYSYIIRTYALVILYYRPLTIYVYTRIHICTLY